MIKEKLQYEFYEDSQTIGLITIHDNYDVSIYITLGYQDASVTMDLDDLKEMYAKLGEMINEADRRIKEKEWTRCELERMWRNKYFVNDSEEFELALIQEGFEETEYGTYMKVI